MTTALPSGLTSRLAAATDYPQLAALLTQAHPERPISAEMLEKRAAKRSPTEPYECLVIARGDVLVGMIEVNVPGDDDHPGWLNVAFYTLENDLGPVLLTQAEEIAQRLGGDTFLRNVLEDWWEKPVYEAHGYKENDRMWPSSLDLTKLDFEWFEKEEAKAKASGAELKPLSSFGEFTEANQRKLHALWTVVERDIPSAVPLSEWPFETWQHNIMPGLEGHLGGFWLAVAPNGDWVGMTGLYEPISSRPGTLHNDLTGVLPEWRGHCIGLALKLAACRSAVERGFTHARTSNHSRNRPMLTINDAMGFVRETAQVTLLKESKQGQTN